MIDLDLDGAWYEAIPKQAGERLRELARRVAINEISMADVYARQARRLYEAGDLHSEHMWAVRVPRRPMAPPEPAEIPDDVAVNRRAWSEWQQAETVNHTRRVLLEALRMGLQIAGLEGLDEWNAVEAAISTFEAWRPWWSLDDELRKIRTSLRVSHERVLAARARAAQRVVRPAPVQAPPPEVDDADPYADVEVPGEVAA